MSHTPYNWIHYVAVKARKLEADYAHVIRGSEVQVAEGPDALELLKGDVKGCTLFTFCEPSAEVRTQAAVAGIAAIYCAISRGDVARLIAAGYNFKTVANPKDAGLQPIKNQRAREEILGHWALASDDSRLWLRKLIANGPLDSDYAFVVRDGGIIFDGLDDFIVPDVDVAGGVLYAICEPDVRVLAQAKKAGIVAVHCVISQHDARRLGYFGPEALEPVKHYDLRKEFLARRGKEHGG